MSALAGVPVGSTASVRQLRVAGTGLQPRLHDKTTRRTDPAGSTLATPDFGPKDGVHLSLPSSVYRGGKLTVPSTAFERVERIAHFDKALPNLPHVPLKEPEWGPAEQFSNRSSH